MKQTVACPYFSDLAQPRICEFFCDVDYYVYAQDSCIDLCHRDIDAIGDVLDSFCKTGSLANAPDISRIDDCNY